MNSNPSIHSSIIHSSIRYVKNRTPRPWLRRASSSTWCGRRSVARRRTPTTGRAPRPYRYPAPGAGPLPRLVPAPRSADRPAHGAIPRAADRRSPRRARRRADAALIRLLQRGQNAHQRRLASAVRAEQTVGRLGASIHQIAERGYSRKLSCADKGGRATDILLCPYVLWYRIRSLTDFDSEGG